MQTNTLGNKLAFLDSVRRSQPQLFAAAVADARRYRPGLRAGFADTIRNRMMRGNQGVPQMVIDTLPPNFPGLSGLGETWQEMMDAQDAFAEPKTVKWYEGALNTLVDSVTKLAPVYVGYKQQKQCLEINAARARAGQPPINCSDAGLTPQVNVGLSANLMPILYGGLAIAGLFLLLKRKG